MAAMVFPDQEVPDVELSETSDWSDDDDMVFPRTPIRNPPRGILKTPGAHTPGTPRADFLEIVAETPPSINRTIQNQSTPQRIPETPINNAFISTPDPNHGYLPRNRQSVIANRTPTNSSVNSPGNASVCTPAYADRSIPRDQWKDSTFLTDNDSSNVRMAPSIEDLHWGGVDSPDTQPFNLTKLVSDTEKRSGLLMKSIANRIQQGQHSRAEGPRSVASTSRSRLPVPKKTVKRSQSSPNIFITCNIVPAPMVAKSSTVNSSTSMYPLITTDSHKERLARLYRPKVGYKGFIPQSVKAAVEKDLGGTWDSIMEGIRTTLWKP